MDTQTKIQELEQKIEMLTNKLNALSSPTTIPLDVGEAFKKRILPSKLLLPRPAITSPTGGVTQDTVARTAIDSIITTLEDAGVVYSN